MSKSRADRSQTAVADAPRRWRVTADQYQRMGEADIFHAEDRVELLDGELWQMAALGSWHNGGVDSLTMTFAAGLVGRAIVRVQGSFRLSPYSEPEPDLLLLRFRTDFFRSALPGPQDVLLLVEVSDTSFSHDHDRKLPLYAQGGIPEVWIVNRGADRVEVYRDPGNGRYQSVSMSERGTSIAPLAFPELTIAVEKILG